MQNEGQMETGPEGNPLQHTNMFSIGNILSLFGKV